MTLPIAPVVRQVAFFAPVDDKGKWHAAWMISHTAVCGVSVDLSQMAIRSAAGDISIHPIVCRRCVKATLSSVVKAQGVER